MVRRGEPAPRGPSDTAVADALNELLRRAYLSAPSDLAAAIAEQARALGARDVVLYLIDYEDFAHATGAPLTAKLDDPQLADPVSDVTRADAQAFCAWASERLGRAVRLLSGDERESLAPASDGRPWPWATCSRRRCAPARR